MKTLIALFGIFIATVFCVLICLTSLVNNAHQIDSKQAMDMAVLSTAKSYYLYEEISKEEFEACFKNRFFDCLDANYSKIDYSLDLSKIHEGEVAVKVENSYKHFNGKENTVTCKRTVVLEEL